MCVNKEKKKCYWTTNIADILECSLDDKFDDMGFAINECPYLKICEKRRKFLKETKEVLK